MGATFLGIPLFGWGGLCLIVAAIYAVFWPRSKAARVHSHRRHLILRWFHALVWVLLALAFFVRGSGAAGSYGLANITALIALAVYVVFLLALLRR